MIFKCPNCGYTVEFPNDYYYKNKWRFSKMYCGDCFNKNNENFENTPKMTVGGTRV